MTIVTLFPYDLLVGVCVCVCDCVDMCVCVCEHHPWHSQLCSDTMSGNDCWFNSLVNYLCYTSSHRVHKHLHIHPPPHIHTHTHTKTHTQTHLYTHAQTDRTGFTGDWIILVRVHEDSPESWLQIGFEHTFTHPPPHTHTHTHTDTHAHTLMHTHTGVHTHTTHAETHTHTNRNI